MNSRLVTWVAPLGLLVSGLVLAFDLPNDSERGKAVGSLAGMDAPMRRAFSDEGEFQKKATPGPMDWLASHPEDGQSFDQWVESKPNLPDAYQRKLYILPIGEFDETAPDIEKLQRYTAAYFYPMAVELLPVVADSKVIAKSRMHGGKKQWNSG